MCCSMIKYTQFPAVLVLMQLLYLRAVLHLVATTAARVALGGGFGALEYLHTEVPGVEKRDDDVNFLHLVLHTEGPPAPPKHNLSTKLLDLHKEHTTSTKGHPDGRGHGSMELGQQMILECLWDNKEVQIILVQPHIEPAWPSGIAKCSSFDGQPLDRGSTASFLPGTPAFSTQWLRTILSWKGARGWNP